MQGRWGPLRLVVKDELGRERARKHRTADSIDVQEFLSNPGWTKDACPTMQRFLWAELTIAVCFLLVCAAESPFGYKCTKNADCRLDGHDLICELIAATSEGRCRYKDQDDAVTKTALVVSIVIPIVAAVVVAGCGAVICCYWVQLTADKASKDVRSVTKGRYDLHELNYFYDHNEEEGHKENSEEEEEAMTTTVKVVKESNGGPTSRRKKPPQPPQPPQSSQSPPQLKVNGVSDANLIVTNGHAPKVKESPAPETSGEQEKAPATPDHEGGYQASMRQLLTQLTHSEPATRPGSAFFLSNSRPVSGRKVSELLRPRPMSAAEGSRLRPMSIAGPYLSDASRLPSARFLPQNNNLTLPKPETLSDLYDKIAAAAEQEQEKEKEVKKPPPRRSSGDGIEEIRLVRVAANAFKRRRNMKKVQEERKKKGKKFETLVDQIIRKREEEAQRPPRLPPRPRRNSSSSSGRSSMSGHPPPARSANGRPESVAQRVLRERQQKRIRAKVPVTSGSQNRPQQQQAQPLHLALKRTTSARPATRSQLTERIKQQVHLNAVKNYQVPVNWRPPVPQVQMAPPSQPIKSILKKNEPKKKHSGSRVNYAFEDDARTVKAEVHVVHG